MSQMLGIPPPKSSPISNPAIRPEFDQNVPDQDEDIHSKDDNKNVKPIDEWKELFSGCF